MSNYKLSPLEVLEVYDAASLGQKHEAIAARYRIHKTTVYMISRRLLHKELLRTKRPVSCRSANLTMPPGGQQQKNAVDSEVKQPSEAAALLPEDTSYDGCADSAWEEIGYVGHRR